MTIIDVEEDTLLDCVKTKSRSKKDVERSEEKRPNLFRDDYVVELQ